MVLPINGMENNRIAQDLFGSCTPFAARSVAFLVVFGLLCMSSFASAGQVLDVNLPHINPNLLPLAEENRPILFKRFVTAFDQGYAKRLKKTGNKTLAEGYAFYYLRQELQSLVDMWRATGRLTYLEQAKRRVFKAIADAQSNQRPLLRNNQPRGNWPCFCLDKVVKQTGGHNQICDFQGAAGFLMVAVALREANQPDWRQIADFVEKNIVEKWLSYAPSIRPEDFYDPKSKVYLLAVLDIARDKREHFATICMDLYKLGYRKYPYDQWARFLTDLYIGIRTDLTRQPPGALEFGRNTPSDWGVVPNKTTGGYTWYYIPDWKNRDKIAVADTAHSNRTVWLAVKAHYEGLVERTRVDGFIKTLKKQIWKPSKNRFYFANFVDGSDLPYHDADYGNVAPGYKGHMWFGWHRLAAYDDDLKQLFISLAYDLTNGGPNMPSSQNKTMEESPLCFYAWAARLLSADGKPDVFP
jgi:hypothetical protein